MGEKKNRGDDADERKEKLEEKKRGNGNEFHRVRREREHHAKIRLNATRTISSLLSDSNMPAPSQTHDLYTPPCHVLHIDDFALSCPPQFSSQIFRNPTHWSSSAEAKNCDREDTVARTKAARMECTLMICVLIFANARKVCAF